MHEGQVVISDPPMSLSPTGDAVHVLVDDGVLDAVDEAVGVREAVDVRDTAVSVLVVDDVAGGGA